jgi:hypothetical protein
MGPDQIILPVCGPNTDTLSLRPVNSASHCSTRGLIFALRYFRLRTLSDVAIGLHVGSSRTRDDAAHSGKYHSHISAPPSDLALGRSIPWPWIVAEPTHASGRPSAMSRRDREEPTQASAVSCREGTYATRDALGSVAFRN